MSKSKSIQKEYLTIAFDDDDVVWQDREIRFDGPAQDIKMRKGEVEIDALYSIEDTKGNNGEKGTLYVTNLRLIWVSKKNSRINLSVGYNCITNINVKNANSRLKGGLSQALYVLTKFSQAKFEFIFTNMVKNSPRLFTSVQTVFKAYESSKVYRDLKLRSAIVKDKELILLPKEEVFSVVKGVWNLSSDQGHLGTLIVTNIRVVWFADLAENFNVAVPYLQFKFLRIKQSKFGLALVIETLTTSGGFVLGFRIDPFDNLKNVYDEIASLLKLFTREPFFGVDYTFEEKPPSVEESRVNREADDVKIIGEDDVDPIAAYYADDSRKTGNENVIPIWNEELGLAAEPIKEGFDVTKLWCPVPKQ